MKKFIASMVSLVWFVFTFTLLMEVFYIAVNYRTWMNMGKQVSYDEDGKKVVKIIDPSTNLDAAGYNMRSYQEFVSNDEVDVKLEPRAMWYIENKFLKEHWSMHATIDAANAYSRQRDAFWPALIATIVCVAMWFIFRLGRGLNKPARRGYYLAIKLRQPIVYYLMFVCLMLYAKGGDLVPSLRWSAPIIIGAEIVRFWLHYREILRIPQPEDEDENRPRRTVADKIREWWLQHC